jgi:aminopeptidase N
VWLSEGFATYFAILFLEHLEGEERRQRESAIDRNEIISYYEKNPSPIVDPSIKDPMKVLNTNSYQKGGWVLHMLRHQLGDEMFWQAIRRYYQKFQHGNALTADLRSVFEEVSGKDFEAYFNQWVFTEGFPVLNIEFKEKGNDTVLSVTQTQSPLFRFPLEVGIKSADGKVEIQSFDITEKKSSYTLSGTGGKELIIDPNVNLLYAPSK